MNYFKLWIGDYQRDTPHLSVLEHGAYLLMLQHYYAMEKPLPTGRALHRMLRAEDKATRDAIDAVAAQFWTKTPEGLVNTRADAEIACYREKLPELEAKRENERDRQRRARERRKALFDTLREHGIVPPYDTSTAELQRLAEQSKREDVTQPVTRDSRVTVTPVTQPVTRDVTQPVTRDVTANHSHSHSHSQTKERDTSLTLVGHRGRAQDGLPEPPDPAPTTPTMASAVCVAMRAAGLASVNPGHPKLLALLEASAPIGAFVGAAQDAADRGKGFAYALAIVEGQLAAAKAAPTGPTPMRRMSAAERAAEAVAHLTGKRDHLNFDRRTIDVESNPLG